MSADSGGDGSTVTLPGGVVMPMIGFGTWQVDGRLGYQALRSALDAGYRHIDTATMYGNETEVGEAVRDSGIPREEIFITTKLPPGRAGRERQTLDESLRALDVDYVDLWLVHWPPGDQARPDTWAEFLAARRAGQARAVGVSNYSIAQIDELVAATGEGPAVNQIPWGPSYFDGKLLADAAERDVIIEGYSPFKHTNLHDAVLAEVAAAHRVTPAQVVLRWHLQHGVVVIPKSVQPPRIRANLDVFGFALTADEMARVDAMGTGRHR